LLAGSGILRKIVEFLLLLALLRAAVRRRVTVRLQPVDVAAQANHSPQTAGR
jgi:hypothetical protein